MSMSDSELKWRYRKLVLGFLQQLHINLLGYDYLAQNFNEVVTEIDLKIEEEQEETK